MRSFAKLSIAAGLLAAATTAQAAVVSLNFEGIASYPNGNNVFIQNFYNGGTSSIGTEVWEIMSVAKSPN